MRVDAFDFELPEDRIALRPANPRDSARLLEIRSQAEKIDRQMYDLPEILRPADALVFNDTKVIPAQLEGVRNRNGETAGIGLTLHMRETPDRWRAFARGAKKLKPGDRLHFGKSNGACLAGALDATVTEKGEAGEIVVQFDLAGAALDEALGAHGHVPLPPYIALKRDEDARDKADYQTVYAKEEGAVAAPTAGLHFTPELFDRLAERKISTHFLTLHVGAGTFLPVKSEDTKDHKMHAERGVITSEIAESLNATRARGGRIVSVGTTSLRLLESAATSRGEIESFEGATDIFITPGYRFRAVDLLLTNFHLPRSTLFMLVSAFSGLETMQNAYAHAIASRYRFYSYGDACLLYPKND